jgi:uncharacterized phage protein (TIGR01671 family)
MQRTIKFRGKTPQGDWVYGFYAIDGDGTYIICDEENKQRGEWYKIIPESAGQFTGLFDKNGTEIYEYDVVKIEIPGCGTGLATVVFNDFVFALYAESQGYLSIKEALSRNIKLLEVIGSIHDNPELLKIEH